MVIRARISLAIWEFPDRPCSYGDSAFCPYEWVVWKRMLLVPVESLKYRRRKFKQL
jgi:hypothetical protein